MANEQTCSQCEYAIFCPSMGEYKCMLYQHRVYFPNLVRSCFVKSKSSVLSRKCNCLVCIEKGYVEDDDT